MIIPHHFTSNLENFQLIINFKVSESNTEWAELGWNTTSTAVIYPTDGMTVLHITCSASNEISQSVTAYKQIKIQCKI